MHYYINNFTIIYYQVFIPNNSFNSNFIIIILNILFKI